VTIPPRTREGVRLIWARNEHHSQDRAKLPGRVNTNQKRARQGHATRAMGPPPLGMWSLWHDMPHTFFFAPVALETALDVCFRHSSWNRAASVRCRAK
jgi:hypothetical protein